MTTTMMISDLNISINIWAFLHLSSLLLFLHHFEWPGRNRAVEWFQKGIKYWNKKYLFQKELNFILFMSIVAYGTSLRLSVLNFFMLTRQLRGGAWNKHQTIKFSIPNWNCFNIVNVYAENLSQENKPNLIHGENTSGQNNDGQLARM